MDEVKRYLAIEYYYSIRDELKKDDPTVEKELALYLEEERTIISELINNWRKLRLGNVVVFEKGKIMQVGSETELSDVSSKMMSVEFPNAIIVNNDLINKNNVSGVKNDRQKVLENIIEKENLFDGFAPLSPGYNIIRSVLVRNGIYAFENETSLNVLPDGSASGKAVIGEIKAYIKNAQKGPVLVNELYKKLKRPPYGLRDGFIPLLVAYELKGYSNVSLSFHGADRDYTAQELIKAFENPEDYSIFISNWESNQQSYIEALESVFGEFLQEKTRNRLKDLLDAMNTHFASVSKSARTTERYVSHKAKQYRDLMSVTYKDYNSFFFDVLPQIDDDLDNLPIQIKRIKEELANVIRLQVKDIEKTLRQALSIQDDESIGDWFRKKYTDSWKYKAQKVFDYQTSALLEYVKSFNYKKSDYEISSELANVITGFEIDYWNDSKIEDFEETIIRIIGHIDGYETKDTIDENEVKIIIQTGGEDRKTTLFDKQELSRNGQLMFNKMKNTIDNFGQALSQEEKMQIMAKLLEEIM